MNSDPKVMEFFPSRLDRGQSDALAARADSLFDKHGFGLWAVEVKGGDSFIGFVGLSPFSVDEPQALPFAPGVEVGWRLAHQAWGHGYAPEAALAALTSGFEEAHLAEIVSFTSTINIRSQRVMEKIGLHRDPADDFQHPRVPEGSALRPHVLYRLTAAEFSRAEPT
jgi:RimJ/RimL family protein N-acetyltransferase